MHSEVVKHCPACGQEKALTAFRADASKRDGRARLCRLCADAYAAAWYQANRAAVRERVVVYKKNHKEALAASARARYLRLTFGLTPEAYEELLLAQGGVCAVCGHDNAPRRLAVDHDHETGVVRGLLCDSCNLSIGRFGDSPEVLLEAAAYLRRATA